MNGSLEGGLALCPRPDANLAQGAIGNRDGTAPNNLGTIVTNITTDNDGANNPFTIDDILYSSADDGTGEQILGQIRGFYITAANKLGVALVLQSDTGLQVPGVAITAATSRLYYKVSDRAQSISTLSAGATTNAKDRTVPSVSYTMSDIEMLVMGVIPPKSYSEGMLKRAMSSGGVSIDYIDSELHRFNQVNSQGVVQVEIPTLAQRCKSVLCQPIPDSSYRALATSSFSGVPDGARNYQFVLGTELIPSRVATKLSRYLQVIPNSGGQRRFEPVHCSELEKALANIGMSVRSLQKIADSFVIARAFNKYGQITDVSDQSLSLRVEYPAGAVQKTFMNYVFKLSRLTVKGGVVSVE